MALHICSWAEDITRQDLEDIYELTYKYQMLKQEAALGDYGLPQQLPDSAYMELERVKQGLGAKLSAVYPRVGEVYRAWIHRHQVGAGPAAQNSAIADLNNAINNAENYDDLLKFLSEGQLRNDILEAALIWVEQHEPDRETLYNIYDDPLPAFFALPYVRDPTFFALVKSQIRQGQSWLEKVDEWAKDKKQRMYESEELGNVMRVYDELIDGWGESLDKNIELFQKALNTAHYNGSMAEYILGEEDLEYPEDPGATEFLDSLSEGKSVDKWNDDLSRVLGYPVGSRLVPQQEWFAAHLKRAITLLAESIDMTKLRVDAGKPFRYHSPHEDLGNAYWIRIREVMESEQYAQALAQVHQGLVDFLLMTIEEIKAAGGIPQAFDDLAEQAAAGMEEQDPGIWGDTPWNLVKEALKTQRQNIIFRAKAEAMSIRQENPEQYPL